MFEKKKVHKRSRYKNRQKFWIGFELQNANYFEIRKYANFLIKKICKLLKKNNMLTFWRVNESAFMLIEGGGV